MSLKYQNVGQYVFDMLKKHRKTTGQIYADSGEEFTFGTLLEMSVCCASWIRSKNLTRDDVIVICSNHHVNAFVAFLACFLTGNIISLWFTDQGQDDVDEKMKIIKPKLIFTNNRQIDILTTSMKKHNIQSKIVSIERHEVYDSVLEILKNASASAIETFSCDAISQQDDTAVVIFSSGTMGSPKPVEHGHGSLLLIVETMRKFQENEVMFWCSQMSWITEIFSSLRAMRVPATRISYDEYYDPDKIGVVIEKYKVNDLFLPPMILINLYHAGSFTKYDMSSLKVLTTSGARVNPKFLQNLSSILPHTLLIQRYACSEAGSILADPKITREQTNFRAVGRPGRGVSVKIVDLESGALLKSKQIGQICLKTPVQMKGYYKMPELTKQTVDKDGYIHSADLGFFDDDDFLYVTGRVKDIIRRNGKIVDERDIENLLEEHPKVKEAVVVGISHEIEGNQPIVFVKMRDNQRADEDLKKELIALSSTLGPKNTLVHVEFINEIPRTDTGFKIKKHVLRVMAEKIRN